MKNKPLLYCGNDDPSPDMRERAAEFLRRANESGALFRKPITKVCRWVEPARSSAGLGKLWLDCFRNFKEDKCILFPFRTASSPRGNVNYNFRQMGAHQAMCLMAHGLPKEDGKKMALHKCGNGHLGCVNPTHLYWGDQSDNNRDARRHMKEGKPAEDDSRAHSRVMRVKPPERDALRQHVRKPHVRERSRSVA